MDGGLWKGTSLCPEEPTGLGQGQLCPLDYINNKERPLQRYRAECSSGHTVATEDKQFWSLPAAGGARLGLAQGVNSSKSAWGFLASSWQNRSWNGKDQGAQSISINVWGINSAPGSRTCQSPPRILALFSP